MNYLYKTIAREGRAEITIEKSKFIATASPCSSREEAEVFFDRIRNEFKDATHNVPAFVIGNKMELKWASDDGEPQGTSGPPILKLLEYKELTNLALVVTRYFGGIKLGTGGLVRAYTESAEKVIEEVGVAGAVPVTECRLNMEYNEYNKLLKYQFPSNIKESLTLGDAEFTDKVNISVSCVSEEYPSLRNILMDMTNGKAVITEENELIRAISLT